MTLPAERTRAVLRTREFLARLASPHDGGIKGVRREVREEARRLLRHYPLWIDLRCDDAFDPAEALQFSVESDAKWLRSIRGKKK